MVKPYFFIPPEIEEYYSKQSVANRKEQELFAKQITPEQAKEIADISYAYPTLDKRLVTYLPQMGVNAADELLLDVAAKQFITLPTPHPHFFINLVFEYEYNPDLGDKLW